MATLYNGIPFSPRAELTNNIGAADTIIQVSDVSVFPAAPNLATIGDDENGETIFYSAKTNTALSGCTRGVEGTAKSWLAGSTIARNFTAKDHDDLIAAVAETTEYVKGNFLSSEKGGNISYSDAFGDGPHNWEIDDELIPSSQISFDNTGTGLDATTVQSAIKATNDLAKAANKAAANAAASIPTETSQLTNDSAFISYNSVVSEGYAGTESTFNAALAMVPQISAKNARSALVNISVREAPDEQSASTGKLAMVSNDKVGQFGYIASVKNQNTGEKKYLISVSDTMPISTSGQGVQISISRNGNLYYFVITNYNLYPVEVELYALNILTLADWICELSNSASS